jgi:lysophospholipase L1-like esterase
MRKLLRRPLIIVGLTLGALALAEGGARLFLRLRGGVWPETAASRAYRLQDGARRLYRRHPYLNTAPREGTRIQGFGRQAAFNSLGYRSPERPAVRRRQVLRVLCAGGSTTFDLLAASDDGTWPWRLEEKLRLRRRRLEVWNAGFPGWTSLESLISLAMRDVNLDPQLIVLYQGDNDLQPGGYEPFDSQYEHGHSELTVRALGFGRPPLPWPSRSLLLEPLLAAWQRQRPGDPWASLDPQAPRHAHLAPAAVATFVRNVRSLIGIARAHGAHVALVTQSIRIRAQQRPADLRYLAQWLPALLPEAAPGELDRLSEALRALRGEEGVQLVDAASRMGWQDEDFLDPLHFSARGSERFADFLAAELLLPPMPPIPP